MEQKRNVWIYPTNLMVFPILSFLFEKLILATHINRTFSDHIYRKTLIMSLKNDSTFDPYPGVVSNGGMIY
ncbi:MAG: hypothetical protein CEE43_12035 [Promethearchaeota archaeon Loki_b32]|nr:MAG: hypothetical protein CEE43_12035 [Candidatus Lokiarchaeota archaeon Loki_b32]